MNKFLIFAGPLSNNGKKIFSALENQGWTCVDTSIADEIDQIGKQNKHATVLFTDAKFAYEFLSKNSWDGFPTFFILFTNAEVSKQTADQFERINVNIYNFNQLKKFLEHLHRNPSAIPQKAKKVTNSDEIEFTTTPDELDKEF